VNELVGWRDDGVGDSTVGDGVTKLGCGRKMGVGGRLVGVPVTMLATGEDVGSNVAGVVVVTVATGVVGVAVNGRATDPPVGAAEG
jgi:hypothetical protein